MSSSNQKCDICFLHKEYDKNHFHILTCCKNNYICQLCYKKMTCDHCPFCRAEISKSSKKNSGVRTRASSFSSGDTPVSYLDRHVDLESLDDTHMVYYSRVYRQQQTQIQRLRLSEQNRLKNQQERLRNIESRLSQKKKEKKHYRKNLDQDVSDAVDR